jgi:pentatricopeptide repeat protein
VSEGEAIVDGLRRVGTSVTVETLTALMKGFAHSGRIGKAEELFDGMCRSKSKAGYPNVRTLNTLLRGCLWSPAAFSGGDGDGRLSGGVVTSERAWVQYKELKRNDTDTAMDVSSYEYSIILLCQALRTKDAATRIEEMKTSFDILHTGDEDAPNNDQSVTEALAVVYLALARAHAVLNEGEEAISACDAALAFARSSRNALKSDQSFSRKRGWKGRVRPNDDHDDDDDEDRRRALSNIIYRDHRLSEVEAEASTMKTICERYLRGDGSPAALRGLARRLATRLVLSSGGGTTDMSDLDDQRPVEANVADANDGPMRRDAKIIQRGVLTSAYFSFGLAPVVERLGIPVKDGVHGLTQKDCNRILGGLGLQGGIVREDGTLDLHRMFTAGVGNGKPPKKRGRKSRRVEVELGAGFGDWIVSKAREDPGTDYVALELRADRAAQVFARAALFSHGHPIDNLCVVGGDSGTFLRDCLHEGSVDSIYVNHPEPPTQTFGADMEDLSRIMTGGPEPAHMLHSNVFLLAAKVLRQKAGGRSRMVIVTDNQWYGRLICATVHKVIRRHPDLLRSVDLSQLDGCTFRKIPVSATDGHIEHISSVSLYEGHPNQTIGYPSPSNDQGNTYFDRLWRAGASTHAERRVRFVIMLEPGTS